MNLLLPVLDLAVRPISPSVVITEEMVENSTNYAPVILLCVAAVAVVGLTIFFIKKNKNNKNNTEE